MGVFMSSSCLMICSRLGTGLLGSGLFDIGSGLLEKSLVISDGNVAVLGVWSLGRTGFGDCGERGELDLEGRVSGDNGVEEPDDRESSEEGGEVTVTVVEASLVEGSFNDSVADGSFGGSIVVRSFRDPSATGCWGGSIDGGFGDTDAFEELGGVGDADRFSAVGVMAA